MMIVEGWRSEVRELLARVPDGDELDRLASHCGDQERAAADQYAAVLGWLGMAATEESTWRRMKLRGAAVEELRRLRIVTALHRGRVDWCRVGGELMPVETEPVSPWSHPVRQVWAAVLFAVCDEQDRAKDEADDFEASYSLQAATPQDRP